MTATMPPDAASPTSVLDRGGHLSELTLDRFRFDPPEPPFRAAVEAHLTTCAACRAALEALVAGDVGVMLAPPPPLSPVVPIETVVAGRSAPRRAFTRSAALGALSLFAAAAIAVFVLRPWRDDPDGLTLKGKAFDFEVHVHDGLKSRPVQSGDDVHPGERMGFRVHLRQDGYLAIFGRDDRGMTYPCYPALAQDAPVAAALQAVAHARTEHPEALPVAMRFDDILGDEHITAVFCREPFALGADFAVAALADCSVSEVTLHKVPAPGGTP